jgi:hypothetical protein
MLINGCRVKGSKPPKKDELLQLLVGMRLASPDITLPLHTALTAHTPDAAGGVPPLDMEAVHSLDWLSCTESSSLDGELQQSGGAGFIACCGLPAVTVCMGAPAEVPTIALGAHAPGPPASAGAEGEELGECPIGNLSHRQQQQQQQAEEVQDPSLPMQPGPVHHSFQQHAGTLAPMQAPGQVQRTAGSHPAASDTTEISNPAAVHAVIRVSGDGQSQEQCAPRMQGCKLQQEQHAQQAAVVESLQGAEEMEAAGTRGAHHLEQQALVEAQGVMERGVHNARGWLLDGVQRVSESSQACRELMRPEQLVGRKVRCTGWFFLHTHTASRGARFDLRPYPHARAHRLLSCCWRTLNRWMS